MTKDLILTIVIKKEGANYSSWCPELDVASQGDTVEEARLNLKEAVEIHVETMIQNGDLNDLLDKVGLSREDLKKATLMPESFSSSMEIALAV